MPGSLTSIYEAGNACDWRHLALEGKVVPGWGLEYHEIILEWDGVQFVACSPDLHCRVTPFPHWSELAQVPTENHLQPPKGLVEAAPDLAKTVVEQLKHFARHHAHFVHNEGFEPGDLSSAGRVQGHTCS